MAEEKAPAKPVVPPEKKPEGAEKPKSDAKSEGKDDGKKQDSQDSKNVEKVNWQEKFEQAQKTWEGRFKKLQSLEKLAEVLAGDENEEDTDPATIALMKVEKMEEEAKRDKMELAKERLINAMKAPEEVKSMLRSILPANDDLEKKANEAIEHLKPLIDKQPLPTPKPQGFGEGNMPSLNAPANEWLKKK